jgi:hypothetical protein
MVEGCRDTTEDILARKRTIRKRKRFEPFWSGAVEGDIGRSVLLIGHVPYAPPTQMPMKIRRYERN